MNYIMPPGYGMWGLGNCYMDYINKGRSLMPFISIFKRPLKNSQYL